MNALLSIAIPTYNRAAQLAYGLQRFIAQVGISPAGEVEIRVCDDCSTDNTAEIVRNLEAKHPFLHYRRQDRNLGLERNLIACTRDCQGDYLWIFGDDDFLETDDALAAVLSILRSGETPFLILNRTRRSFDLSRVLTKNWMRIPAGPVQSFATLRDFCCRWGIISIIGFISVNIFLRRPFLAVADEPYYGIMYPQLGMMLEAFARQPCRLVTQPLVCHRTQTLEEKRAALGHKEQEKDFMSDYNRRDAIYFSFRLIRFLDRLIAVGAFRYEDLADMREFVFQNCLLKDFLLRNMELAVTLGVDAEHRDWPLAFSFFDRLHLDDTQRQRLQDLSKRDAR